MFIATRGIQNAIAAQRKDKSYLVCESGFLTRPLTGRVGRSLTGRDGSRTFPVQKDRTRVQKVDQKVVGVFRQE